MRKRGSTLFLEVLRRTLSPIHAWHWGAEVRNQARSRRIALKIILIAWIQRAEGWITAPFDGNFMAMVDGSLLLGSSKSKDAPFSGRIIGACLDEVIHGWMDARSTNKDEAVRRRSIQAAMNRHDGTGVGNRPIDRIRHQNSGSVVDIIASRHVKITVDGRIVAFDNVGRSCLLRRGYSIAISRN